MTNHIFIELEFLFLTISNEKNAQMLTLTLSTLNNSRKKGLKWETKIIFEMIFIKLVFSESVLGGILLGQALEGMKKTL